MAGVYPKGSTVLVRGRFYDEGGQPTDPNTARVRVRAPNGVVTESLFTDPGTIINRTAQGIYTAIILGDMDGRWGYQWSSTTASPTGSIPGEEGYFDIKPSAF